MSYITEFFSKGGILIIPLLLLLIVGLAIIVFKALQLRRKSTVSPALTGKIEQLVLDRNILEATALCKQNNVPMSRVMLAGIVNYEKPESELKEILEEAGRQEIPKIRSYLPALGTIASVAPLLGLLGTVIGMIEVFSTISQEDSVNPGKLAGGISQALITTAFGMVIAMPTLAAYNYFIAKVQTLVIEMEKTSLNLVAALKRG